MVGFYSLYFSFTKADAHLYGRLFPILYMNIAEYENLRDIILKYEPLVDYLNDIEKTVDGASLLN